MMAELLVRYLHFLGIIVLASMLVAEHIFLKAEISREQMRRLALFDLVYGISALVVLASGLTLWFGIGKPADFYTPNPVFHTKLTFFVIMALISIYPTAFIFKRRRTTSETIEVPRAIIMAVRLELTMLVLIPLTAVFMARGYGLS